MKMKTKDHGWYFLCGLLALVSFCFVSCKDDNEEGEPPFDPSRPVAISDFTPKEGGLGSRLVLYGDNFGNDVSRVKVTIGGQNAKVVGVKNQSLHCYVPSKAYEGDIEVTILDEYGEELAFVEAEEKFTYKKKMLVTTFLGETYENNTKYDIKDGPFNDCGGVENMLWMVLDPFDHDYLYVCGGNKSHRVLNFKDERLETITFPSPVENKTLNVLSFSTKGELIAVRDVANTTEDAVFFYSRESGFKTQVNSFIARGCRSASAHPRNGEIYTSRYDLGVIGRYDPETKVHDVSKVKLPYSKCQIFTNIHPTGKYMYITLSDKHYIMRSDYDEAEKTFTTPYLVCGKYDTKDWVDGMGNNARLNTPRQGCFVKNPDYAGQEDEYDYYFCEIDNHCIRKLTPQGRVSTYAGRPNGSGTAGFNNGDLRLEARFNKPICIVYDDVRECFFVGDSNNHRIRKIAMED